MARALLVLAILLAVAACDVGDSTNGSAAVDTSNGQPTPTTGAAVEQPEPTTATGEPRTIELDVASPPIYDSRSGITLTIDDARIGDLASLSPADMEELAIALENPNSQSFLILTITVENGGEIPIGFFPDQGTALIGSEQVDANFLLSESFTGGGGTILNGASVTNDVYFEVSQPADNVAALGQARYTVSGPFNDASFDSVGEDVDLTVEWSGSSG
jgi:hypothetical protein